MSISLLDFPEKPIFVLLEDNFRKQTFEICFDITGSRREFAKFLGVSYNAVTEWYHGRKKRSKTQVTRQFCPLWVMDRVNHLFVSDHLEDITKEIERHIIEYRSHSGRSIVDPILPVPEKPKLMNLLAHILGDGSAIRGSMPHYSNTCEELRREFMDNLKIFGDVGCFELFSKNWTPKVLFPTVIIHFLEGAYPVDLRSKTILDPSFLFKIPEKMLFAFLKGIFDDEGHVHDSNIQICSIDDEFLHILRELLKYKLNIETSDLLRYQDYFRKDGSLSIVHYFDVYSNGIPKFAKFIGFTHPKKRKFLDYLVVRQNRGWKLPDPEILRKTIIGELRENDSLTARELSIKTLITAKNLRLNYLHPMEREGIVQRIGKRKGKGGPILWRIKG